MAATPSASASTAAKSAETKKTNEAHDETAAAVPAGTRDVNLQESTPSGPITTPPRIVTRASTSAAVVRARRTKAEAADEDTVKVRLKVRIPSMDLKVGDEAELPESFANRLLAAGDAVTPEEGKALDEADRIKAEADRKAKEAEEKAAEVRNKAREAEAAAHAKAEAVREEARADVQARTGAAKRGK